MTRINKVVMAAIAALALTTASLAIPSQAFAGGGHGKGREACGEERAGEMIQQVRKIGMLVQVMAMTHVMCVTRIVVRADRQYRVMCKRMAAFAHRSNAESRPHPRQHEHGQEGRCDAFHG